MLGSVIFQSDSAPERAAMEMLHLVPKEVGFDEAQLIVENLVALRADVVQRLLEACRSVKVKRLFLYMGRDWDTAGSLSLTYRTSISGKESG